MNAVGFWFLYLSLSFSLINYASDAMENAKKEALSSSFNFITFFRLEFIYQQQLQQLDKLLQQQGQFSLPSLSLSYWLSLSPSLGEVGKGSATLFFFMQRSWQLCNIPFAPCLLLRPCAAAPGNCPHCSLSSLSLCVRVCTHLLPPVAAPSPSCDRQQQICIASASSSSSLCLSYFMSC